MKLNLTTGLVSNLNVSISLLAFVFLRTWTKLLSKAGIVTSPFTRQENTIVQTCVVAYYSIVVGGGFGSYLLGLNTPGSTKEPGFGWMTGFLFIMIIDYKLSYPSGTANAVLINGFHTPTGDKMARKQLGEIQDKEQVVDDQKRNEVFLREGIPLWVACFGYITFSIISIIAIPLMFPELKWYYAVVAYILAPSLSFCNAYGAGLTDMNMAYNYGKVALFLLAALAGKNNGVVAGLVGCGLIKSIVSISSDLMHDFKTGHLTLTSPRSMLVSQAIGTVIGCVVAPFTFFLFYKAFDVENPDGEYKAPYAIIYRNMAILGVEGFSALPRHCLQLCYGFFAFAISANLSRDLSPKNIGKYVPLPMAMAVPFLVGAYFAIDMCLGSLVVFAWHKLNSRKASLMVPAVASGLICGDGLWILPSSILALARIRPPICMSFRATN
ncbi:METAL-NICOTIANAMINE TRANSPORTER YSL3 [Salix koriyanagi]|uniref:METAL-NICOTIANAMINE TRANSPORTER YSL3 n=1 Tax=Salix koriyanagi TaxID=2511006 RepID=A0A9Q1AB86_9ROSI|nr:METAL-NICOTIANAMINE TRANSPORTER YSL3 [Salix koriyanagi]